MAGSDLRAPVTSAATASVPDSPNLPRPTDSKEVVSGGAEPRGATEASIPSKGSPISRSNVSTSSLRAAVKSPAARGSACASRADVSHPMAKEGGPEWYAAGKKGMPAGTLKEPQN
eukprot:scaffold14224_cov96-Isochrysis_galbana.AAC.4